MSSVTWKVIQPNLPFYRFKPQENKNVEEYQNGWSVVDMFPTASTGIKTHRDHFAIEFDKATLEDRIANFRNLKLSDKVIREQYDLPDTRDWKLPTNRKSLSQIKDWQIHFTKCLYRPFDKRDVYYHPDIIELPRPEVMEHLLQPNLCLLTMRRIRTNDYSHFLVSNNVVGKDAVSIEDACFVYPLYLYPVSGNTIRQRYSFDEYLGITGERKTNLSQKFINEISRRIQLQFTPDGTGDLHATFGPEDVFHFMYSVFHSPTYRSRYAQFLKIDFPRLPLTSNVELFRELCALGKVLVEIHLLESPKVDNHSMGKYTGNEPSNPVEKGYPKFQNNCVHINLSETFRNVANDVWNFHIGGYQVCEKWLKDRRGRQLSREDIAHYQKIVNALGETIRLMGEVDEAIESAGGWPIV